MGAFKYYINMFGGEVRAKMMTLWKGEVGGLGQNADILKERGGRVEM